MILHLGNEVLYEPGCPHDRIRVGKHVLLFKHDRYELPPAHPASDDADDQADAVLLRHVAEEAEAAHHLLVHARPVLERTVGLEERAVRAAGVAIARERLEVRPQREDAHHRDAVLRKLRELALHHVRLPVAPHVHARMFRPVVATDEELALREDAVGALRLLLSKRRRRGRQPNGEDHVQAPVQDRMFRFHRLSFLDSAREERAVCLHGVVAVVLGGELPWRVHVEKRRAEVEHVHPEARHEL